MARIFQVSLLLEEADHDLASNASTRLPAIAEFFLNRYVVAGYDPTEDSGYANLVRRIAE